MPRQLAGLLQLLKMIMNKSAGRTSQEVDGESLFAFTENNLFCCNDFVATYHLFFYVSVYPYVCHDLYLLTFFWRCCCRNDDAKNTHYYDGKVHLLKTKKAEACLGASPNEKLTSKELKRDTFSPCRWHANQVTSGYF